MHDGLKTNYKEVRKFVAKLFYAVLTGKLCVRDALVQFPKDSEDKTIIASWHALCHLDADEDLRAKDTLYRDVQDDYIEFIANTLEQGRALPDNIIESYYPYHSEMLIADSKSVRGIWNKLKKFLCC